LLRAALSLSARGGLRPWTYHCLFGLLSVTGLRLGEACNLEIRDVDLQTNVLTIRNTKFGKNRLIPIHPSTRRVLADYLERRNRRWARRPASSYVFVSNRGNRLDCGRSTECSTSYLGRLVCVAHPIVAGRVCMT
jgi:integrase/recombinase XerD